MKKPRKILVTNALTYTNGALHLGHIVGYIQSDIWVRALKMAEHDCLYLCGGDSHGTPIMLNAEKQGISPEALISRMEEGHKKDIDAFHISFDQYYTTHSPENKALVEHIYHALNQNGHIEVKTIQQAFDPLKNLFLPDRFIKGDCPRCGTKDQYGDNCEQCGATYSPTDLKNPYSTLSGATPIVKESEHYFFKLPDFEYFLKEWTQGNHLQSEASNKLHEWFEAGLQNWDISRDSPYFGFTIPGTPDKYFYVWLDAPIGYIAIFKKLCETRKELSFEEYWKPDSPVELYHFIGKDIIYFHALFWPALLHGAGFRTPTAIYSSGFLTVDGQKMSKSRGTFINARTYLNHLPPEYLRYYFATKLSEHIEDLDIGFDDFTQKVNSDLVGKYINIASRTASFLHQQFDDTLSDDRINDHPLFKMFVESSEIIQQHYEKLQYSQAMRHIMSLADAANQWIDEEKPWVKMKDPHEKKKVHFICSLSMHLFKILTLYLKPVLPETAQKVEAFLNLPALQWKDAHTIHQNHRINVYQPLLTRIDKKQTEAMKMSAQSDIQTSTPSKPSETQTQETNHISIDDFNKLDLRVAKIIEAEHVEGADKLLKLKVDLGNETRQIFAGIKSAYQPDQLLNKHVVVVANLAPRQMRFGLSEGMVLCAGPGGKDLFVISPEEGASAGMKVK